jgi:hypothetical protein
MLQIFERRTLRTIYFPVKCKDVWRTRCSTKLYVLCSELDIVKVAKTGRMRWLGHLFKMQKLDPCGKLTVLKPEGTRRVGNPKLR